MVKVSDGSAAKITKFVITNALVSMQHVHGRDDFVKGFKFSRISVGFAAMRSVFWGSHKRILWRKFSLTFVFTRKNDSFHLT